MFQLSWCRKGAANALSQQPGCLSLKMCPALSDPRCAWFAYMHLQGMSI